MGSSASADVSSALFGKTRRAILALLFSNPDESYYLRQIIRLLQTGQGGVQRELQRLAEASIILRTVQGRTAFYSANPSCPVFDELQGLIIKTAGVAEVLRAALVPIESQIDVAFIYGSAAKGRLRAASDVDVFVIGAIGFGELVDQLASAQARLGREVNPAVFDRPEFERRLEAHDHFVGAVVEGPKVFVIGGQRELDQLAGGGMAGRTQGDAR